MKQTGPPTIWSWYFLVLILEEYWVLIYLRIPLTPVLMGDVRAVVFSINFHEQIPWNRFCCNKNVWVNNIKISKRSVFELNAIFCSVWFITKVTIVESCDGVSPKPSVYVHAMCEHMLKYDAKWNILLISYALLFEFPIPSGWGTPMSCLKDSPSQIKYNQAALWANLRKKLYLMLQSWNWHGDLMFHTLTCHKLKTILTTSTLAFLKNRLPLLKRVDIVKCLLITTNHGIKKVEALPFCMN